MAEERDDHEHTEDPTPRRLEEAIRRGDVARSIEVSTWFTIAGGTLVLMLFAAPSAGSLQTTLRGLLANAYQLPADGPALGNLAYTAAQQVLTALAIPLILLALAALIGNAIQHRPLFSVEPIIPRLSKISPAAGLSRTYWRLPPGMRRW